MRFKLDTVEPVKLYAVLREEEYPFILESAEKLTKRSRYSFLSANPDFVVEVGKRARIDGEILDESNPFEVLRKLSPKGFLVGYVAYDAVHNYIRGEVVEPSVFGCYPNVFIYDHAENALFFLGEREKLGWAESVVRKARSVELREPEAHAELLSCDADREDFVEMVEKAKDYIFDGEAFQVVLSREYELSSDMSAFDIYLRLRKLNPSPYMFCIEFDKSLAASSPETMCSIEGKVLKVNPIAGTAGRGESEEEDEEIARRLLNDEKELAEHVMLVDLARNDVRKVSKPGSVKVTMFMEVLKYSHVQHIESEVIGELASDAFTAVEACFPAGTLVGAPKVRAMEIIDELERSRRRVYGGCVGYFSADRTDMAIAIRMVEIDRVHRVRAGAGIVADSNPEREFEETERKMAAVLAAMGYDSRY
ncbi:MAG: anthranilate synthase component I [Archaeoglobaceae archaeon]